MGDLDFDDVESFEDSFLDDEITDENLELKLNIAESDGVLCNFLGREGNIHYCTKDMPDIEEDTPRWKSMVYNRQVSAAEIQMYCLDNCEQCSYYTGNLER